MALTKLGPTYVCKVRKVRNCFFAASGSSNPSAGFDLFAIGQQACDTGETILDHAKAFQSSVMEPMSRFIDNDRRTDAEHYQKLLRDGVVDVAFFGVENGKAVIIQTGYELSVTGTVIPFLNHSSDAEGDIFKLGQVSAFIPFLTGHPEVFKQPLPEQAKRIVLAQAAATPDLVGGTLTVISITPEGDTWTEPGHCDANATVSGTVRTKGERQKRGKRR